MHFPALASTHECVCVCHETLCWMQGSYHGVPLIGIPLFGEQSDNIAAAKDRGYALSVNIRKLDTLAKDLELAVKRVLTEPSFAAKAARISQLMKAHRQSPPERASGEDFWPFLNASHCLTGSLQINMCQENCQSSRSCCTLSRHHNQHAW